MYFILDPKVFGIPGQTVHGSINITVVVQIMQDFAKVLYPLRVLAKHSSGIYESPIRRAAVRIHFRRVVKYSHDYFAASHLAGGSPDTSHYSSTQFGTPGERGTSPLSAIGGDSDSLGGHRFSLVFTGQGGPGYVIGTADGLVGAFV